MVFGKFRDISVDSGSQLLGFSVVLQICVISNYQDGVDRVPSQVSPSAESPHDGKQFLIINRVVLLGFRKGLGVESQQAQQWVSLAVLAFFIGLVQDGPRGEL